MTDTEFLDWMADRLVHVYKESNNVDHVQRLRWMAKEARGADEIRPHGGYVTKIGATLEGWGK